MRRITRCAIFLLVGITVSFAVAACAIYKSPFAEDQPETFEFRRLPYRSPTRAESVRILAAIPDTSMSEVGGVKIWRRSAGYSLTTAIISRPDAVRISDRGGSYGVTYGVPRYHYHEYRCGWPLSCIRGHSIHRTLTRRPTPEDWGAIHGPQPARRPPELRNLRLVEVDRGSPTVAYWMIPTGVDVRALAANTTFYATLAYGLSRIVAWLRAFRRSIRGRCPDCGYGPFPGANCPECGAAGQRASLLLAR